MLIATPAIAKTMKQVFTEKTPRWQRGTDGLFMGDYCGGVESEDQSSQCKLFLRFAKEICRASASLAGQRRQAERPPYKDARWREIEL